MQLAEQQCLAVLLLLQYKSNICRAHKAAFSSLAQYYSTSSQLLLYATRRTQLVQQKDKLWIRLSYHIFILQDTDSFILFPAVAVIMQPFPLFRRLLLFLETEFVFQIKVKNYPVRFGITVYVSFIKIRQLFKRMQKKLNIKLRCGMILSQIIFSVRQDFLAVDVKS